MRVLDQTVCKPFGSTEISTFAFSKFWFFMFTKHCQALLLEKPKLGYRNFFLQKIKITPKRLSVFIEIPALSLPMYISSSIFSVSLYFFMYICYPVLSVSILYSYFCFDWSLRSSSRLPCNNSSFLFCWIYVIDLGFLHGGLHFVRNLNVKTYFDWRIFCCRCLCFWVVDLFGFLVAFDTCPFGFWLKLLHICRHKCHWNQNFVFFFCIKVFSLFCFSFKNQDCVYGR